MGSLIHLLMCTYIFKLILDTCYDIYKIPIHQNVNNPIIQNGTIVHEDLQKTFQNELTDKARNQFADKHPMKSKFKCNYTYVLHSYTFIENCYFIKYEIPHNTTYISVTRHYNCILILNQNKELDTSTIETLYKELLKEYPYKIPNLSLKLDLDNPQLKPELHTQETIHIIENLKKDLIIDQPIIQKLDNKTKTFIIDKLKEELTQNINKMTEIITLNSDLKSKIILKLTEERDKTIVAMYKFIDDL